MNPTPLEEFVPSKFRTIPPIETYWPDVQVTPDVLEVTWDGEDETIAVLIMECLNRGFEVHVYRD